MQVWWVPLLFFVVSFGTISLSCSLAFARGDARGIPHISQCGMHQPERTIFGIGEMGAHTKEAVRALRMCAHMDLARARACSLRAPWRWLCLIAP